MNITDMIQSAFWRGSDFENGEEERVTIKDIYEQLLGQEQERKWCMSFHESTKQLTLGKRNLERAAKLYGNDTDNWLNKPVILCGEGTQTPSGQAAIGVRISLKRPALEETGRPLETDSGLGLSQADQGAAPPPPPPPPAPARRG